MISVELIDPQSHFQQWHLTPECNHLSQFMEDTGEPFTPVQKFNLLACLLAQSSWKTPFYTQIWTLGRRELSPRQPSRHCGGVAY